MYTYCKFQLQLINTLIMKDSIGSFLYIYIQFFLNQPKLEVWL